MAGDNPYGDDPYGNNNKSNPYGDDPYGNLSRHDPYNQLLNDQKSSIRPKLPGIKSTNDRSANAASNLKNAEQAASANPISSVEGPKNAKSAEENTPFTSSVTGREAEDKKARGRLFRKAGPSLTIGGISIFAFIGFSAVLTPFLMLNHIVTMATEKWGFSEYSLTRRTQLVFGLKGTGAKTPITTGGVFKTNIGNRYRAVSAKTIGRLEAKGFTLDLGETTLLGKSKLNSITYSGTTYDTAGDFVKGLRSEPAMRADLNRVYKPRVAQWFDSLGEKFKAKFNLKRFFSGAPQDAGDDIASTMQNETKATQTGAEGSSATQEAEVNNPVDPDNPDVDPGTHIEDVPMDDVDGALKQAKLTGGKATASKVLGALNVLGIVQTVCGYYLMIEGLAKMIKTSGLDQIMTSVSKAFSVGDQVKEGHGSAEGVSAINTALNTPTSYQTYDPITEKEVESEPKAGSSAQAYQYAVQATTVQAADGSASKYTMGGIPGYLRTIYQFLTGAIGSGIADVCGVVTNPIVVAITTIASIALAIYTFGGTAVITSAAQGAAGTAIMIIANVGLNLALPTIAAILAGDISCLFAKGQDMMNCLMIGFGGMAGKTAGIGGNTALTKTDAQAMYIDYQEYLAEVAEEERASKSPFDPTSPYTFLGSIASSFLPYFNQTSSVLSPFSSLASVASSSMTAFMPKTSAFTFNLSTFKDSLNVCDDNAYNSVNMATDPYCNPLYGSTNIDADPEAILDNLMTSFQLYINEDGDGPDNSVNGRDPKIQQYWYKERDSAGLCGGPRESLYQDTNGNGELADESCKDGTTDLYTYETDCALRRVPIMMAVENDPSGEGKDCLSDYTYSASNTPSTTFALYFMDNRSQEDTDSKGLIGLSDEFLNAAYEKGIAYYISADPESDMYIAGYYDDDDYEPDASDLAYAAYVDQQNSDMIAYLEDLEYKVNLAQNGSSLKPSPAAPEQPTKISIEQQSLTPQYIIYTPPTLYSSSKSKSTETTA
jgi:hypothetical protein